MQLLIRRADLFSRLGELEAELQILSQRLEPGWRITAEATDPAAVRLTIPIRMKRGGGRVWITGADGQSIAARAADQSLAGALKQAHGLVRRKGVVGGFASEVAFASTYERHLMQLAFLAPDLQLAILDGRQPVGMTLQNLIKADVPPAWEDQRRMFAGLAEAA